MKKILPIIISVFIILINILPANAMDNVLRGVNVRKDKNSYTIELTSTVPARMTKNILSANRVIINLKDIEISKNLYTKYNGATVFDNVMVEPCGYGNVNVLIQGDNVAYSNVEFKAPTAVENAQETVKASFSSLFGILTNKSGTGRGVQFGILAIFLAILIGEARFIKSKYDELQTEKEKMLKDIENTKDFKNYLPGYGKTGLKKPYTTPLYTGRANTNIAVSNHLRHIKTPETITLNSLLKNNNQESKIIDRIINNTPVFGSLSNININDNVVPIKKNTVSNPLERAKLKSNIKYLENVTSMYRTKAALENSETELRTRLNKIY